MKSDLCTDDPAVVAAEVQRMYRRMFPGAHYYIVPQAFGWAIDCFTGHFEDYQPVDTRYHDFEHTLQGTLCMTRILYGRYLAEEKPALTENYFELGLLAILLHDTGYLKQWDDNHGTGAKYTAIHVGRSAEFAAKLLLAKKYSRDSIRVVQNLIRCTGVDASLDKIPFQNEMERMVGCALGAADLLGQMAAEDYLGKLPVLYAEFAEAATYSKSPVYAFSSADDLVEKTPAFWEKVVQGKLQKEFGGVHRFLNSPYPDGTNSYVDHIEANLRELKQRLSEKRSLAVKS